MDAPARPSAPDAMLATNEWAVLGLLAERTTHGFEIAQATRPDGEVGRIWSLRRPLVYHAIDSLTGHGLARELGTQASPAGPARTLLGATPAGRALLSSWLATPVERPREVRSLLLLKLLFHARAGTDPAPLLLAQRARFAELEAGRRTQLDEARDFGHTLALWRLETVLADLRFIDRLLEDGAERPARSR